MHDCLHLTLQRGLEPKELGPGQLGPEPEQPELPQE